MEKNKKCPLCGYLWKTRTTEPKACPRCKRRFDYPKRGVEENVGAINSGDGA